MLSVPIWPQTVHFWFLTYGTQAHLLIRKYTLSITKAHGSQESPDNALEWQETQHGIRNELFTILGSMDRTNILPWRRELPLVRYSVASLVCLLVANGVGGPHAPLSSYDFQHLGIKSQHSKSLLL